MSYSAGRGGIAIGKINTGCWITDYKILKETNTIGLNSEFSLSLTGFHTKVKEPILTYHLSLAENKIVEFILSKGISAL